MRLLVAALCLVAASCSTNGNDPSEPHTAPSVQPPSVAAPPDEEAPMNRLVIAIKGASVAPMTVTIVDDGVIKGARPATRAEIDDADAALFDRDIAVVATSEVDYLLVWSGSPCDASGTVTVSATSIVVAPDPRAPCDAIATGWGVVLTYEAPDQLAEVAVILQPSRLLPEAP
jgi:hypothetical protein